MADRPWNFDVGDLVEAKFIEGTKHVDKKILPETAHACRESHKIKKLVGYVERWYPSGFELVVPGAGICPYSVPREVVKSYSKLVRVTTQL